MKPFLEELSRVADTNVHVYPNAGLPNPLSETGYDETPEHTSSAVASFAKAGLVNMVGGCCGTTPEHIAAVVKEVSPFPPRAIPTVAPAQRLSGLEAFNIIKGETPFVNMASAPMSRVLHVSKTYQERRLYRRTRNRPFPSRERAQIIDINFDEGMLDGEARMTASSTSSPPNPIFAKYLS